jgi:hypothetical protein
MKLSVLGFALAASAIAYSSLQLIEPDQRVSAGGACCTVNQDCRVPGWTCANSCNTSCSAIDHGYCGNTNQCPPGN